MCVMEIRSGQRTSTMAQAMAHNVGTIRSDLELFLPLIEARGDIEARILIQEAQEHMDEAYARFVQVFANEVSREIAHVHDEPIGNERIHVSPPDQRIIEEAAKLGRPGMKEEFTKVATVDAHRAEKYETR